MATITQSERAMKATLIPDQSRLGQGLLPLPAIDQLPTATHSPPLELSALLAKRVEALEQLLCAQQDEIVLLKRAVANTPANGTTTTLARSHHSTHLLLQLTPQLRMSVLNGGSSLSSSGGPHSADSQDVIRLLKQDISDKLRGTRLDLSELNRYIDELLGQLETLAQVRVYYPDIVTENPPAGYTPLEFFELPIIDQLLVISSFNDSRVNFKVCQIQGLFMAAQVPFHYWGFYGTGYLGDVMRQGLELLPLWPEFIEYLFRYKHFYDEDLHHMQVWLGTKPRSGQLVLSFISKYKERAACYKEFPGKFTLERDRLVYWLKRAFPNRVAEFNFDQVVHREPFYQCIVQLFSGGEQFT